MRGILTSALLILTGAAAAASDAAFFPAPHEKAACGDCRAVVAGLGAASAPDAEAAARALEARGFHVTVLRDPPAYRLHHAAQRLFATAAAGAKRVFWYRGRVLGTGDAASLAGASGPSDGSGADGLRLGHLFALARGVEAETLFLFDAVLPADTLPALADRADPFEPLILARTGAAGPAAELTRLLSESGALERGAVREALAERLAAGYPAALQTGRAEAAAGSSDLPPIFGDPAPLGGFDLPDLPRIFTEAHRPRSEDPTAATAAAVERCRALARDPNDPTRTGDGTPFVRMETEAARLACREARLRAPGNAAVVFGLGTARERAQDYRGAAELYERAANFGFAAAKHALGLLTFSGRGVARDQDRAISLMIEAARAGHMPSLDWILKLCIGSNFGVEQCEIPILVGLLEGPAKADPERAYLVGVLLTRKDGAWDDLDTLRKAERAMSFAASGGIEKAVPALRQIKDRIAELERPDPIAVCDEALAFDVTAIEEFYPLPAEANPNETRRARQAEAFRQIDMAAVREACSAAIRDPNVSPALLGRLGYFALFAARQHPELKQLFKWDSLMRQAARAGDPGANLMLGTNAQLTAFGASRKSDWAGMSKIRDAADYFSVAMERGNDQAAFYWALINIETRWEAVPGFRQDPGRGAEILARLAPRSAKARGLLEDVRAGSHGFHHVPAERGGVNRTGKPRIDDDPAGTGRSPNAIFQFLEQNRSN